MRQNAPYAGGVSKFALIIRAGLTSQLSSLEGPRKDVIDAMQKQIDVHLEEINKQRSIQNSQVPVSGLPAELLSEVFRCIVESSLQYSDTCFSRGTFSFREVCSRWNDVAVGSPQLWVRWASDAVRAWPLFKARSKNAPIFVTWQPDPERHIQIPGDTVVPGRIRQLYFSGTGEQSDQFFSTIESTLRSDTSSVRVHISPHSEQDTQDHLTLFLSSSFPKLSKLDIENYQPDPSSSVFTTSSLTSLQLSFPHGTRPQYTLAQLSRILQRYPNLRKLDLRDGALPQIESTELPVPFTLPRLVDLKLFGTVGCIFKLVNLIDTSPPPRSILLCFCYPHDQNVPALIDAVKKILAAYYECEGLDDPRKVDYLSISGADQGPLIFFTQSRSPPQPTLELQFSRADDLWNIFPLFPSKDTREFAIGGVDLDSDEYYTMFRKMKGVLRLHVLELNIGPVLEALNPYDEGASKGATRISCWVADLCADKPGHQPVPKLESLTLSNLDFLHGAEGDLLEALQGRLDCNIGLKWLVFDWCRVHHSHGSAAGFNKLVEEVEWNNVEEMGSDYNGSDYDGSDYNGSDEDPGSDED